MVLAIDPFSALTMVTPFTARDNVSYLQKLNGIRQKLNELIEYVSEADADLINKLNEAIESLEIQWNSELESVKSEVITQITTPGSVLYNAIIEMAANVQDPATAALINSAISETKTALKAYLGVDESNALMLKRVGTNQTFSFNASPANSVGPNASQYTIFGGAGTYPHAIGNSSLAFFAGYDNKNWDNSIASHNTGHHSINGGLSGHPTITGGSMGVNMSGYGFIGGGTDIRSFGVFGVNVGGQYNISGATAVCRTTLAIEPGDTTIAVDDVTGIVINGLIYIGAGTPALSTAGGDGPLERARVTGIVGNVLTLDRFWNVQGVGENGLSTAVAFASEHPANIRVAFVNGGGGSGATVGGGANNHALGAGSTIPGGLRNEAKALYTFAVGADNKANEVASSAVGQGAVARMSGQFAYAGGYTAFPGDSQGTMNIRRLNTTVAAPASLPLWQKIPNNATARFSGSIVARNIANGDSKEWSFKGLLSTKPSTHATPTLVTEVGVTIVSDFASPGAADWNVTTLTGALTYNFRLYGAADTGIRWVVKFDTLEVLV